MSIISERDVIEGLPFSLHDMLALPKSESLVVEVISGPTTAITLRVRSDNNPDFNAFVKTVKKDSASDAHIRLGIREVQFYQFIEGLNPDPYPNIPRCLNSGISPDEKAYFLVLEDLSDSHQDYQSLDFSNLDNWRHGLRALAKFHRSFTGKSREEDIQTYADDEQAVEAYIKNLADAFRKFRRSNRDCVPESTFKLLEECIPLIRAFELEKADRVRQNQLTTLLHRDAHLRNFLYPRVGGDDTMIVDWQFWGLGIGTFDLRHLLGSALPKELRRHQEELVRYYHQNYSTESDNIYSFEDCWSDYRKGIVDNLFMPVWQFSGFGWGVDRWGKTLTSALENFYDLNCDEFLKQK